MFPQIFGKYVLERELASGGMARVYLATLRGAVGFEKRLVVKQIRPELSLDEAFVRRFVEEAKIAVELSHPNIVPVYELGVELGIYYMAMELCEGLTLTEILLETGPLDAAEGAHVGVEICRALDYAHRRGNIVHRDVTPRNVLLDEEGAIRLIDFGIAAPVTEAGSRERIEVFGSPGHMPPEQIRGEPLSPATDVFAVAALLVEAWTGRPPFRRGSFEASAAALTEPRAPLEQDHPELAPVAPIVAQALALRPEDRPQEAEQLARRLREFSRQFDSGDVAKRLGERVRRARRRSQAAEPWLPGDSSGPLTPAASPRALLSSRPPGHRVGTPSTPRMPRTPATPPSPTSSAPITRTFAARGDLVEWTRKIGSLPPPPDEPASDTDHTPPPSVPPPGEEPPTRALPPPGKSLPTARRTLWVVSAAGGLALGAALLLVRSPPTPSPAPAAAAAPPRALVAPPEPASSLGPASVRASAEPPPLPSIPSPRAPGRVGSAASVLAAPSTASPAVASGILKLTADPPATVTVTGGRSSQTLSTPVRALSLPAGGYSLTFRSATFGEPVVARVELSSGATRSVHADFRAAIPTVVVR